MATDSTDGLKSLNPLYMKFTPSQEGKFVGQQGYGYRSLENFVQACREVNAGLKKAADFEDGNMPTMGTTLQLTAILEAGRWSLDRAGQPITIIYDKEDMFEPVSLEYVKY